MCLSTIYWTHAWPCQQALPVCFLHTNLFHILLSVSDFPGMEQIFSWVCSAPDVQWCGMHAYTSGISVHFKKRQSYLFLPHWVDRGWIWRTFIWTKVAGYQIDCAMEGSAAFWHNIVSFSWVGGNEWNEREDLVLFFSIVLFLSWPKSAVFYGDTEASSLPEVSAVTSPETHGLSNFQLAWQCSFFVVSKAIYTEIFKPQWRRMWC